MAEPSEESLRALYVADVNHISEMKERQWVVMKWVVGLTATLIALSIKAIPALPQLINIVAILLGAVSALGILVIVSSQFSLTKKRERLWRVYEALELDDVASGGDAIAKTKKKMKHTSFFYNWWIWGFKLVICVGAFYKAVMIAL